VQALLVQPLDLEEQRPVRSANLPPRALLEEQPQQALLASQHRAHSVSPPQVPLANLLKEVAHLASQVPQVPLASLLRVVPLARQIPQAHLANLLLLPPLVHSDHPLSANLPLVPLQALVLLALVLALVLLVPLNLSVLVNIKNKQTKRFHCIHDFILLLL
jgi:hypothetical protein